MQRHSSTLRSSLWGTLGGLAAAAAIVALAAGSFATAASRPILEATGVQGGLVVHVGCGDGRVTASLHAGPGYLVQGLEADPAKVDAARRHLAALGLSGVVSVDRLCGNRLPYVDNLVRLVVSENLLGVPMEEVMRVLAPGGTAYLRSGGVWRTTVKPWPREIDQWTHYLHGPDNNAVAHDLVVGPPRHIQWLAAPVWTRNHHTLNSVSSVVTAQGRLFSIVDEASPANINLPGKWALVARDAFSGVTLWKRPIPAWAWHQIGFRSGPPQVTRLLVASGDRVYAPLGLSAPVSAMDAATGKTAATFDQTAGAEEIILAGSTLLVLRGQPAAEHAFGPEKGDNPHRQKGAVPFFQLPNKKSLVAVDAQTGKTLWTWSDPEASPMPETLASDGTSAYLQIDQGVACLDLSSGKERWRYGPAGEKEKRRAITFGKNTLVVAEDVVLCNLAGNLTAIGARDGKKLWDCKAGDGFHSPLDVFVIRGLVWQGLHGKDSVAPPAAQDFSEGRDLHTGEVKAANSVAVDLQTAGHHHRCYREKATDRFIIAGKRGIEMMDLAGSDHCRNNWVRGTCQYGILPANGLLYAPPHSCACYMESKLRGFWALAPEGGAASDPSRRIADDARLETGPAYPGLPSRANGRGAGSTGLPSPAGGRGAGGEGTQRAKSLHPPSFIPHPSSFIPHPSDDWPAFRHDSLRRGVATTRVPAELRRAWQTTLGGRLTQPVVAGGRVVLAGVDEHAVYALDEQTGKLLWKHLAGGRVDSPPTIHKTVVLFGSADGRVTCLRLSDGALVWRLLAAPADLRTVALDRVESVWPVHGSVLVLGEVAYCSAGRSTWLDGGIDLWGLDPATGKVLCKAHFESRRPQFQEGKDKAREDHETRITQNVTDYKTFLAPDRSDSFSMAGGTVSDVLVSDGANVYLHQAKFNSKLEKQEHFSRHLFSTSSLLDDAENHRSHWVLGSGDFSRVPVAYSWIVDRPAAWTPSIAVPTGVMMVYDDRAVWGVRNRGNANGKYELFKKENRPLAAEEKSLPDFRPLSAGELDPCVWKRDLPVRTTAMLKSGSHLFLGVAPVEIPEKDPHAAYEGRRGASVWVCSESGGTRVAQHALESPVVWDGMAAAHGRLYLATVDGKLLCLGGIE